MKKVKHALARMKIDDKCKDISFKSWRAGRATELLKENVPVAQIFEMGEWKGAKSVVRYADEDVIDPVKLMEAAIDYSDDEELKEEKEEKRGEKRKYWGMKR